MTARVARIRRHPIKAIGGEDLGRVRLDAARRLPGDRIWALLTEGGERHAGPLDRPTRWLPKSCFLRGAASAEQALLCLQDFSPSLVLCDVMLGDDDVEGGWMTLRRTTVGHRSFVGNGAYVPDGSVIPPNVLIGVQSRAPESARMKPGDTWFGTPPIQLPAREVVTKSLIDRLYQTDVDILHAPGDGAPIIVPRRRPHAFAMRQPA